MLSSRSSTLRAVLPACRASLLLSCLVGAISIGTASMASAAVNHCKPLVKADPVEANTATNAKRLALTNWTKQVSMHGVEYTRWGISWNHEIVCVASGRKTMICQAAGHPCAVRQVPPDNFIPFRRGVSKSAIDREGLTRHIRREETASAKQP